MIVALIVSLPATAELRRTQLLAVALGIGVLLAGPAAYTINTMSTGYSSGDPRPGPAVTPTPARAASAGARSAASAGAAEPSRGGFAGRAAASAAGRLRAAAMAALSAARRRLDR